MATASNPAKALLASLKPLGVSAAQARQLLPEWWDDEAATTEGGLLELKMLLARRLGVSFTSLLSFPSQLELGLAPTRFKTVHPEGSTQLRVAAGIGQSLARIVAAASPPWEQSRKRAAAAVREQVLTNSRAVDLQTLCQWCWSTGLPVVHLRAWPKGLRRPDAMCALIDGRAVILVVRAEKAPARLAYLVAHELGHIALGHLQENKGTVLVDEALAVDKQASVSDPDERAADDYAIELLGGNQLRSAAAALAKSPDSPLELVAAAMDIAQRAKLDAGQVLLTWGRNSGEWAQVNAALRYLMDSDAAPEVINALAMRSLRMELLGSDDVEHLSRLTTLPSSSQ
jgi:hypothetical protein